MNLPHPFQAATNLKPNPDGSISLLDTEGKSLARIPLSTAFELSPEAEGHGFGVGYGNGYGYCDGYGRGHSSGYGVGYGSGGGSS